MWCVYVKGETYEYVRVDKGFRYVSEQVSHHPVSFIFVIPVSSVINNLVCIFSYYELLNNSPSALATVSLLITTFLPKWMSNLNFGGNLLRFFPKESRMWNS